MFICNSWIILLLFPFVVVLLCGRLETLSDSGYKVDISENVFSTSFGFSYVLIFFVFGADDDEMSKCQNVKVVC